MKRPNKKAAERAKSKKAKSVPFSTGIIYGITAYSPTEQCRCLYTPHCRATKAQALRSASQSRWISQPSVIRLVVADASRYKVVPRRPKPPKRKGGKPRPVTTAGASALVRFKFKPARRGWKGRK